VSNPKILVLGAGGTGGYFGGRLAESGADVKPGVKSSPSRGCRSRARSGTRSWL
jgi:2-dehydropantoate 2-reductase